MQDGYTYEIINFLSGVLQGCPGSAFLFNNALDPFLVCFSNALGNGAKGIVRACADDLAFALSRLKHLELLYPIFAQAESIGGLKLKPQKCKIAPLVEENPGKYEEIESWIKK